MFILYMYVYLTSKLYWEKEIKKYPVIYNISGPFMYVNALLNLVNRKWVYWLGTFLYPCIEIAADL